MFSRFSIRKFVFFFNLRFRCSKPFRFPLLIKVVSSSLFCCGFLSFFFLQSCFNENHLKPFQGSLTANMVMGIVILKKRYQLSKYLSVAIITAGIFICTIVSAGHLVRLCQFNVIKCHSYTHRCLIHRKPQTVRSWCMKGNTMIPRHTIGC